MMHLWIEKGMKEVLGVVTWISNIGQGDGPLLLLCQRDECHIIQSSNASNPIRKRRYCANKTRTKMLLELVK